MGKSLASSDLLWPGFCVVRRFVGAETKQTLSLILLLEAVVGAVSLVNKSVKPALHSTLRAFKYSGSKVCSIGEHLGLISFRFDQALAEAGLTGAGDPIRGVHSCVSRGRAGGSKVGWAIDDRCGSKAARNMKPNTHESDLERLHSDLWLLYNVRILRHAFRAKTLHIVLSCKGARG